MKLGWIRFTLKARVLGLLDLPSPAILEHLLHCAWAEELMLQFLNFRAKNFGYNYFFTTHHFSKRITFSQRFCYFSNFLCSQITFFGRMLHFRLLMTKSWVSERSTGSRSASTYSRLKNLDCLFWPQMSSFASIGLKRFYIYF